MFVSDECILIIEDQEDQAALYEVTLKRAGYRTRIAQTGEEGVAEFRANGADLVLLDMTLPEMNGLQVLREVREIKANMPVIVITAETNPELRQQCERLGVQDYLAKPVNFDAMLTAVKLAIEVPPEEVEIVTLRLSKNVVAQLSEINSNLGEAIMQLIEQRMRKGGMRAAAAGEDER